jgi:hypothetical protein
MFNVLFLFWLLFAIVVAVAARARGRGAFGWFLLAVVISPLLAAVLLAFLPVHQRRDHQTCSYCAEVIKRQAIICKHCGRPPLWAVG